MLSHFKCLLNWLATWLAAAYRQLLGLIPNPSIARSPERLLSSPHEGRDFDKPTPWSQDSGSQEPPPAIVSFARPPDFDYDHFVELMLPSEKKLRTIFPHDHEMRTKFIDLHTEEELVDIYKVFAFNMKWECKEDSEKHRFYSNLFRDLLHDFVTVKLEFEKVQRLLSPLAVWELAWIDNEGGTSYLEEHLAAGHDPFELARSAETAARQKYGAIVPKSAGRKRAGWSGLNQVSDGNIARRLLVERPLRRALL